MATSTEEEAQQQHSMIDDEPETAAAPASDKNSDKEPDDDDSTSSDSSFFDEAERNGWITSRWKDMVEVGVDVNWPNTNRTLSLTTQLAETEIAPLFNGTQWAGTRVWRAATVAIQFLTDHVLFQNERSDNPQTLVELGCGLGVPGMVLSELNPKQLNVILTEQETLVPQLQENVTANFSHNKISVRPLSWSPDCIESLLSCIPNNTHPLKIVLNCDCVYEPLYGKDASLALSATLLELASQVPGLVIVMSVERRNQDGVDDFVKRLQDSELIESMELSLRNDDDRHHVIEIYVAKAKE